MTTYKINMLFVLVLKRGKAENLKMGKAVEGRLAAINHMHTHIFRAGNSLIISNYYFISLKRRLSHVKKYFPGNFG